MALTFPRNIFMEMFLLGAWKTITTQVRQTDQIKVVRGRGGEQGDAAPTTLTCKLDNASGDFTPANPLGQWYGAMKKGTPIRFGLVNASDAFGRTVASGWGTADTGEAWVSTGGSGGSVLASDWNVAAGVGTHSVPTTSAYRYSTLPVNLYNVEVAATTTVPITNVTVGPIEPCNLIVRHSGSTYYMTRVSVSATEVLTITLYSVIAGVETQLLTPVTVTGLVDAVTNKTLRVKMQAEGQTVRAKVYAAGAEPVGWHVEIHDTSISTAGSVGIRNGVGAANTNAKPIVFSNDSVEVRQLRFAGEVVELKPRWNLAHSDSWAELVASTALRRIRQGKTPLKSTLRRGYLADAVDSPIQYWPFEDGKDVRMVNSAIDDQPMSIVIGRPRFGEFDDFIGSSPLPILNGAQFTGRVSPAADTGELQLRFLFGVPIEGMTDNLTVAWLVTSGSLAIWELQYRTGGGMSLNIYDASGTLVGVAGGSIALAVNGQLVRVSLELTQSGGNVNWGLSRYDITTGVVGGSSGSAAGTLGIAQIVHINPRPTTAPVLTAGLGHVVVQNNITSSTELSNEYGAWRGESPLSRFIRLGTENGFGTHYIGSSATYRMGPQQPTLLTNLLKECQDASQGTLFDSRMSGNTLAMRVLTSMYAQDSKLTLNYAGAQIAEPFQPSDDDRPIRNDITAKRTFGGEYRVSRETGSTNAQDPGTDDDAVGRYDQQYTANVQYETQLPDIAGWELNLGTTEAERWPKLRLNLQAASLSAATEATILDLDLDDRVTVTGLDVNGYYDDVELLLRGYTEVHSTAYGHTIEFNCAPYDPYTVAVFNQAASRWDTANSDLTSTITSSALSFQIDVNKGELWTTTASQFPLEVMVGGERIRLSAISGASSPQTATVDAGGRSVNGVVATHTAGAKISVAGPVYFGR